MGSPVVTHIPPRLHSAEPSISFRKSPGWEIPLPHAILNSSSSLPREAVAFALHAGKPDLALEWLEQGRSVIWNQLLSLRASVTGIQRAHPDFCAEFVRVSHELRSALIREQPMDSSSDVTSLKDETQHHHRLAEKWDVLVEKIRSHPDFVVARRVYERLLSEEEPNSEQAARALYEAVEELRELSQDLYQGDCWLPFVRYGI